MKSIHLAMTATTIIYICISILGIVSFGHLIKEDVLKNIGEEGGKWEQYVLQIMYAFILATHIPFIFFPGKESFLIIVDEIQR